MNIDTINSKVEDVASWQEFFQNVFARQEELRQKYDVIEKKNGIRIPEKPWNINDRFVQFRLKDMFWRFTEEIGEAFEVVVDMKKTDRWLENWDMNPSARHFFEELADALHFLTEATLLSNISYDMVASTVDSLLWDIDPGVCFTGVSVLRIHALQTIVDLGIAANMLKNKPWKVTHMVTDEAEFREKLLYVWKSFFVLFRALRCPRNFIYTIYMKKSLVNSWRQKTKY